MKEFSCHCCRINNWNKHKNFSHHRKLNQHWDYFFFLNSFSLIIFCFMLTKSMLIKGRRKGLFCLLWGTKVNKSLGYIQRSSLCGDRSNIEKVAALFEGKITLLTLLLLGEILGICSTEREACCSLSPPSEKVCVHDCMCVYENWKESSLPESIATKQKRPIHQMSAFLLFSVSHFHHTVTVFLVHVGYWERPGKSLTLGHFFYIRTNFMLNKVLKGNVDRACIKHCYLQLPHLVSSLKVDWFITLSTLSLFSMTLAIGGAQRVCLNLFSSCQPEH